MIENHCSPQAVKAFCVGQAKSGTGSLWGLLKKHHRADHEPEREQTLAMILKEAHGEVPENSFRAYLRERDRRLNLEYDIAWANQFIIPHLLQTFPDARFIVLIRDPYTWLQSVVGQLLSRDLPQEVLSFLPWWFDPKSYPHTLHDDRLGEQGLYSVEAYLRAWNRHVDICVKMIPPSRRLILRTHELGESQQQLAQFLQISVEGLDHDNGHMNRSTWSGRIESLVKGEYLTDMVSLICGDNTARYFPEITRFEDVSKLWAAGNTEA